MICSNCGKEIPYESKFCPFCGNEVVFKTFHTDEPTEVAIEAVAEPAEAAVETVEETVEVVEEAAVEVVAEPTAEVVEVVEETVTVEPAGEPVVSEVVAEAVAAANPVVEEDRSAAVDAAFEALKAELAAENAAAAGETPAEAVAEVPQAEPVVEAQAAPEVPQAESVPVAEPVIQTPEASAPIPEPILAGTTPSLETSAPAEKAEAANTFDDAVDTAKQALSDLGSNAQQVFSDVTSSEQFKNAQQAVGDFASTAAAGAGAFVQNASTTVANNETLKSYGINSLNTVLGIAGGVISAISVFLSYVTISAFGISESMNLFNGTGDGFGDGILILILGIACAVLAFMKLDLPFGIVSIIDVLLSFYVMSNVGSAINEASGWGISVSYGLGRWLLLLGVVALAAAAALTFLNKKKD